MEIVITCSIMSYDPHPYKNHNNSGANSKERGQYELFYPKDV